MYRKRKDIEHRLEGHSGSTECIASLIRPRHPQYSRTMNCLLIGLAPHRMGPVASVFHYLLHQIVRRPLEVVGPAYFRESVQEHCRRVQMVTSEFGCLVVPWKNVMIVVPSFSQRHPSHQMVLRWPNGSTNQTKSRKFEPDAKFHTIKKRLLQFFILTVIFHFVTFKVVPPLSILEDCGHRKK